MSQEEMPKATQSAEDLERVLAEIDAAPLTQTHDVVMRHWPTIRATLADAVKTNTEIKLLREVVVAAEARTYDCDCQGRDVEIDPYFTVHLIMEGCSHDDNLAMALLKLDRYDEKQQKIQALKGVDQISSGEGLDPDEVRTRLGRPIKER